MNSGRVEYMLVGGYALAFHGHPRATGDLDIRISPERENMDRVGHVVRAFGFADDSVTAALQTKPGRVIRMGVPPLRIALLTAISGVEFEACAARRQTKSVNDLEISVIGREDLVTNKRAAGRAKDLADLEELA